MLGRRLRVGIVLSLEGCMGGVFRLVMACRVIAKTCFDIDILKQIGCQCHRMMNVSHACMLFTVVIEESCNVLYCDVNFPMRE